MPPPLISVTLPNYNYGRFLREALESVLQQSYPHFEILFVDDGSTDNSREIARELAARDPRLKPVYFETNQGVMKALDNAWSRASGELIYQFSSDDAVSDPDFFRRAVDALAVYPEAAGFYGEAMAVATETGEVLGTMGSGLRPGYMGPEEVLRGFLRGRLFVPGISSIWRRDLLEGVGGFTPDLGPLVDFFVNHALSSVNGVVFHPGPVARARISVGRSSLSSSASPDEIVRRLVLFEKKLRGLTGDLYPGVEKDWAAWRAEQVRVRVYQESRLRAVLMRVEQFLRMILPPGLFRLARALWRRTLARLLPFLAHLTPQYRKIEERFRKAALPSASTETEGGE